LQELRKQLISWLPHYKFLPMHKKEEFMDAVLERYIKKYPITSEGKIVLLDYYLHVIAKYYFSLLILDRYL
jgi:hypothetical protein